MKTASMTDEERKAKRLAYQNVYAAANKEKIAAQRKVYKATHKEERREYGKAYRAANKEREVERKKAYYDANKGDLKGRMRAACLKHNYGITLPEYYAMRIAQNNQCRICSVEFGEHHTPTACHVDHEHGTAPVKIRGLLCHTCNIKLGHHENAIRTGQRAQFDAYLGVRQDEPESILCGYQLTRQ